MQNRLEGNLVWTVAAALSADWCQARAGACSVLAPQEPPRRECCLQGLEKGTRWGGPRAL